MYLGHDFGQLSDASPIDDSNDNDGGGGQLAPHFVEIRKKTQNLFN